MKYYFLVITLCSMTSYSQQPRKGLVVLNNGDTLAGWISYRSSQRDLKSIQFYKDSVIKNEIKYGIDEVTYFELADRNAYLRATVDKTVPIADVLPMSSSLGDTTIKIKAWLKIRLLSNRYSLYELTGAEPRYYIREKDGDYAELKRKMVQQPGYEKELGIFREQLNLFALKYGLSDKLSNKIEITQYNADDLAKMVVALNEEEIIIQRCYYHVPRPRWNLFFGAGVSFTQMQLSGDKSDIGDLKFDPSYGPFICLGADLSDFGVRKLTLRAEVDYSSAEYNGEGPSYTSSTNIQSYELDQKVISIVLSALYNIVNKTNLRLYAGVGFGTNFSSYKKNIWKQTFPERELNNYANLMKNYVTCQVQIVLLWRSE